MKIANQKFQSGEAFTDNSRNQCQSQDYSRENNLFDDHRESRSIHKFDTKGNEKFSVLYHMKVKLDFINKNANLIKNNKFNEAQCEVDLQSEKIQDIKNFIKNFLVI